MNDGKQSLIKAELIFRQVDLGEQKAFGKKIIGDRKVLEQVFLLDQLFQLLESFRHEEELKWKGVLIGVLVELREEGIVGKLFQHQPRVEMLGEQVRKRGLARANIAFYGNET